MRFFWGTSRVIGDPLVVCKYRSALLDEENPRGTSSAPPLGRQMACDLGRHPHAGVPWRRPRDFARLEPACRWSCRGEMRQQRPPQHCTAGPAGRMIPNQQLRERCKQEFAISHRWRLRKYRFLPSRPRQKRTRANAYGRRSMGTRACDEPVGTAMRGEDRSAGRHRRCLALCWPSPLKSGCARDRRLRQRRSHCCTLGAAAMQMRN